jgi:hypothetical protein
MENTFTITGDIYFNCKDFTARYSLYTLEEAQQHDEEMEAEEEPEKPRRVVVDFRGKGFSTFETL